MSLANKTLFITGASRGIGLAIAKRAAMDGANIVIAAKTTAAHPKLPGTIHTAAESVESVGGQALACKVDIRDEESVREALAKAADRFGGIDCLINNASALIPRPIAATSTKSFDLMMGVNARGTFICAREAIPYLKQAENPHILNLAPPLNLDPKWFKDFGPYVYTKYGMSMMTLALSEELRHDGIAANSLWPRTVINTSAINEMPGMKPEMTRKPEIVADAAYEILRRPATEATGNFYVVEDVLESVGVADFSKYSAVLGATVFAPDPFLD